MIVDVKQRGVSLILLSNEKEPCLLLVSTPLVLYVFQSGSLDFSTNIVAPRGAPVSP
jgi:hypothetical protein